MPNSHYKKYGRKSALKNADKIKKRQQIYRDTHKVAAALARENTKEERAIYNKQYILDHIDEYNAYQAEYYEQNKDMVRNRGRRWEEQNKDKRAGYNAKYNGRREHATPLWADMDKMALVYLKRNELNELWDTDFQVDHIIPLKGELVSGLHCWANLQLLDRNLNASKSNKLEQVQ